MNRVTKKSIEFRVSTVGFVQGVYAEKLAFSVSMLAVPTNMAVLSEASVLEGVYNTNIFKF